MSYITRRSFVLYASNKKRPNMKYSFTSINTFLLVEMTLAVPAFRVNQFDII